MSCSYHSIVRSLLFHLLLLPAAIPMHAQMHVPTIHDYYLTTDSFKLRGPVAEMKVFAGTRTVDGTDTTEAELRLRQFYSFDVNRNLTLQKWYSYASNDFQRGGGTLFSGPTSDSTWIHKGEVAAIALYRWVYDDQGLLTEWKRHELHPSTADTSTGISVYYEYHPDKKLKASLTTYDHGYVEPDLRLYLYREDSLIIGHLVLETDEFETDEFYVLDEDGRPIQHSEFDYTGGLKTIKAKTCRFVDTIQHPYLKDIVRRDIERDVYSVASRSYTDYIRYYTLNGKLLEEVLRKKSWWYPPEGNWRAEMTVGRISMEQRTYFNDMGDTLRSETALYRDRKLAEKYRREGGEKEYGILKRGTYYSYQYDEYNNWIEKSSYTIIPDQERNPGAPMAREYMVTHREIAYRR